MTEPGLDRAEADEVAKGELPAVRIGRSIRVEEEDWLRYVARHKETAR